MVYTIERSVLFFLTLSCSYSDVLSLLLYLHDSWSFSLFMSLTLFLHPPWSITDLEGISMRVPFSYIPTYFSLSLSPLSGKIFLVKAVILTALDSGYIPMLPSTFLSLPLSLLKYFQRYSDMLRVCNGYNICSFLYFFFPESCFSSPSFVES